jgi:hypothetical protein
MKKILLILLFAITIFTSCKKDSKTTTLATPNYNNFKITSIKITAIPLLNAYNSSWDLSNGPDVYFNISDINSSILLNGSSNRITDISATSLPLNWNLVAPFRIIILSNTYYISVYDYDSPNPDQLIGFVEFKMSNYSGSYPTTIHISSDELSVAIIGDWY